MKAGEIFGLVGPDAAGKTTTIRMLCGILPPDRGEATVAGCDIRKDTESLKEKVGYLPQRFGLYGDLTVLENIHFYADLYQVAKKRERKGSTGCFDLPILLPLGKKSSGPFRRNETETGADLCFDPYA